MLKARISVNGMWYQGESNDTYDTNVGGEGWHVPNHHELNELAFGDAPGKQLIGMRNLKSHIERVMRRINDGQLRATEVRIVIDSD